MKNAINSLALSLWLLLPVVGLAGHHEGVLKLEKDRPMRLCR